MLVTNIMSANNQQNQPTNQQNQNQNQQNQNQPTNKTNPTTPTNSHKPKLNICRLEQEAGCYQRMIEVNQHQILNCNQVNVKLTNHLFVIFVVEKTA